MSSDNGQASSHKSGASVEAIEAELAQTRAELADTVDQLSAKLDVKTRTKDGLHAVSDQVSETVGGQVHALRDLATDDDGRPSKTTWSAGGAVTAVGAAVAAVFVWRRNR